MAAMALPSCTLHTVPPTPRSLPVAARQWAALLEDLNECTCAKVARSCSWIAGVEEDFEDDDVPLVEHEERMTSWGTIAQVLMG